MIILKEKMKKGKSYHVVWLPSIECQYEDVTCIKVMPKSYEVSFDRIGTTGRINHGDIMELKAL